MAQPNHTYGAKCRLAPVARVDREDDLPPIEAQFFYSSLVPIDDPLSTGSITGTSETRSGKGQLRPFSRGDNNALEKAWLSLLSDSDRKNHKNASLHQPSEHPLDEATSAQLDSLIQSLAFQHWNLHRSGYQPQELSSPVLEAISSTQVPVCCSQLVLHASEALDTSICGVVRRKHPAMSHDEVLKQIMEVLGRLRQSIGSAAESRPASPDIPTSRPGSGYSTNPNAVSQLAVRIPKMNVDTRNATGQSSRTQTPVGSPAVGRPPILDDGISGKPFVRVGSPGIQPDATGTKLPGEKGLMQNVPQDEVQKSTVAITSGVSRQKTTKEDKHALAVAEVAVGVSRLHMVSLPMLQMKPIYWSPVNDIAVVTRATWFYRDTMLPIPPAVANQLEAGYHELKPWTQTWSDEISCAIDVGPLGEEKVSHRLWPPEASASTGDKNVPFEPVISSDPFCAARCFRGEAAAEGSIDSTPGAGVRGAESQTRAFSSYHVIYKNATQAFLLKPSLKPSAYYGRRPLLKITKGLTVGVPVVRGFDLDAWERIHHKKQVPNKPGVSAAIESHESSGHDVCAACTAEKSRSQVTDLVLVAHGIGQKFAERVESFHFTHAINGFRRAVNVELQSPLVQHLLREGQNGLMILPLNWRTGLSFEDGGPMREEDKAAYTPEGFGLKDIEPDTIPAVRSIISDVMFDIPFYMSHHKSKMIQALISEANRVYRLWCRNNPGFAGKGRVHMIGHSLGSAMCLEILSKQPTMVPEIDLSQKHPETRFFEFDTKNLFLVGSPAGFFLLLERGTLMPRRGRSKPGADPSDVVAEDVVGEAGTFGCLAIDNLYNILAKEDPIAYLLTGAVDANYAASLKAAYVPSTATSLWKSVGDAMRNVVPGMAPAPNPLVPEPERPPTVRLPSQLELEVHDFTREEIAEKKAFLLNDNGQIDWYLRSSGGPLEIQYLNMLSAHTSYWYNHDFIRMLCVEIGRRPGRAYTLPAMRAVKAAKRLLVN